MKHEIINDINLTLRSLMEAELKVAFRNVNVKLADLESFKKGETKTGINIFPYAITVNEPGFRTQQEVRHQEAGPSGEPVYIFHPRPVPLTLSFMFTPFATDPQTEYRLMGRILQIMQENATVLGSRLKGEWLPKQGRVVFSPDYGFSVDRQMEIFRAYDIPFKMSIGYMARTFMDSDKIIRQSKVARGVGHSEGPQVESGSTSP